jgi:monoamine oxidase
MLRRKFLKKTLSGVPAVLLSSSLLAACDETEGPDKTPNGKSVLVIGAGISGLAAAAQLKREGFQVTIIEAQEKVGGRLRTDRSLGVPFDEGASWIHGPRGNPISDLAEKAKAKTFLTDDDSLLVYDGKGKAINDSVLDREYAAYEDALEAVTARGMQDKSFETVFNGLYPDRAKDPLWKYMLSAYLEFDTGSDLSELSSIDFDDDELFKGEDVIITNGYDTIAEYLAKGLTIKLAERVNAVDYSSNKVKVSTNKSTYEADYALVTVPLGVLKKEVINFNPVLPTNKQQAIAGTKMSAVNKFLLTFPSIFWDNNIQYVGFTPETKGKFNYFMNCKKFMPANALMTFAFGNYGKQTESMSDAAVTTEIMAQLKIIYGNSIPNPQAMLRTKWSSNPNAYGSYSFPTNGRRSSDFDVLAQAVNNKLFFAGEHTNREYRGTVHGAYLSGIREADKIADL